jgi:hypothetical protein
VTAFETGHCALYAAPRQGGAAGPILTPHQLALNPRLDRRYNRGRLRSPAAESRPGGERRGSTQDCARHRVLQAAVMRRRRVDGAALGAQSGLEARK